MESALDDTLNLAIHIDRLMRRIHADLAPRARAVDDENIGPLGGMVLMTIEDHAPVSPQALATLLARDKGQMTRHIQMLERRGLLLREASELDRRVTHIRLTPTGRQRVQAFRDALAGVVSDMLGDIDASERRRFLETLGKLIEARPGGNRDAQ